MTREELIEQCNEAISKGISLYLKMKKFPKGFPEGEAVTGDTYKFNPDKVRRWAKSH